MSTTYKRHSQAWSSGFYPTQDELNHITALAWGESGIRALLEGRLGTSVSEPTYESTLPNPSPRNSKIGIRLLARELRLSHYTVQAMITENHWTLEQASLELTRMLNREKNHD